MRVITLFFLLICLHVNCYANDIWIEVNGIKTNLIQAVEKNDFASVKKLVEMGANVNRKTRSQKNTPLSEAARRFNQDIIKYLILHNADVNKKVYHHGSEPVSILNELVAFNDIENAKLIFSHGFKLTQEIDKTEKPIALAAYNQNIDMIKLLLQKGASIEGESGDKALMYAALRCNDIHLWKFLLSNGAKLDEKLAKYYFLDVVKASQIDFIKEFMKLGCNPFERVQTEIDYISAIEIAEEMGNSEIIELLDDKSP